MIPNATQHKWPSKDNAQEAHEAIRPTNFSNITIDESPEIQQLYTLIHERASASCMPCAVDEVTTVESVSEEYVTYNNAKIKALFKATATREVSKGWRQLMVVDNIDDQEEEGGRITNLPRVGDVHSVKTSKIDSKITLPPPRYTEGSLIKKLENLGIGRPSTYASILQNIIGKAYIQIDSPEAEKNKSKNSLFPTNLGFAIINALESQQFVDYDFTSKMEKSLDDIANGKNTYLQVVTELYQTVKDGLPRIKLDTSMIPKPYAELPCPKCGKLVKRVHKKDDKSFFFWVHSEKAEDNLCDDYLLDAKEKPVTKQSLEQPCPKCGEPVKRIKNKDSKSGFFWAHVDESDSETCERYLLDVKEKPVTKESLEQPCPKCSKSVKRVQKKDKSGSFWVHVDEAEGSTCDRFLPDAKGKPSTQESSEQPCPFCNNPIKRLKSRETQEWFWAHLTQPAPNTCNLYMSDIRGKPSNQRKAKKL